MYQVPHKATVNDQEIEATVLATPSTLPGVPPTPGPGWAVLLFPDGEVRYFSRSAIKVKQWRDA